MSNFCKPTYLPSQKSDVICGRPLNSIKRYKPLFNKYTKNQEASNNFRIGFALSKRPHLHRAYLVTVCKQGATAVRGKAKDDTKSKFISDFTNIFMTQFFKF